jgi:hypothetical protein
VIKTIHGKYLVNKQGQYFVIVFSSQIINVNISRSWLFPPNYPWSCSSPVLLISDVDARFFLVFLSRLFFFQSLFWGKRYTWQFKESYYIITETRNTSRLRPVCFLFPQKKFLLKCIGCKERYCKRKLQVYVIARHGTQ